MSYLFTCHVVNQAGISVSSGYVQATKGAIKKIGFIAAGHAQLNLPSEGNWYFRAYGGYWDSDEEKWKNNPCLQSGTEKIYVFGSAGFRTFILHSVGAGNAYCKSFLDYLQAEGCKKCACPVSPPAAVAASSVQSTGYEMLSGLPRSSTRLSGAARLSEEEEEEGKMATTSCRWFLVAQEKLPSYFITGGNQLNTSVMVSPADGIASGAISLADLTFAMQAVVEEFVRQGEDAADAEATLEQGNAYLGDYNGQLYMIFDTASGVFITQQKCGVSAQLPFVIGGAALLGIGGFAWGYSRKGKGKKRGVPAYALMAATVGMLAGAAGGYGVARLMSSQQTKAWEKMGLLNVERKLGLLSVQSKRRGTLGTISAQRVGATRFLRKPCPPGMFWSSNIHRCIRPL